MFRPSLVARTTQTMSSMFKAPGATYGQGLQIAHILKCAKRRTFDDSPHIRARRHVLLYGNKGTIKSTSSSFFLRQIAGCVTIGTLEAKVQPRALFPRMMDLKAGVAWEKARGSCDAVGFPTDPLLPLVDWVYCSELMSFLGHTPASRADRMELLNVALEEGDVAVSLVKMSAPPLDDRIEFAKSIPPTAGYHYDPETATVSYRANFSFAGCTRPLPPDTYEEMEQSGYISRHGVLEYKPTKEQAEVYADNKFGDADPAEAAWCLQKNLDLWRTTIVKFNAPPKDLLSAAVRVYNRRLREICEAYGIDIGQVSSGRDDMDLAQLMAVSALDTIISTRALGDTTPIQELEYTEDNIAEAVAWSNPKLLHLMSQLSAGASEDKMEVAGKAVDTLQFFLQTHKSTESRPDLHGSLTLKDFAVALTARGLPRSTVYRHFAKLQQAAIIAPLPANPSIFVVDSGVMRALGFAEVIPSLDDVAME